MKGKRIVITRPPHQAAAFAEQLRAQGAEPITLPTITIEPLADTAALDTTLRQSYDWAIFTSANTVEHVWRRCTVLGVGLPPRIAAVGAATAHAMEQRGLHPDLIPSEHTAAGLFADLSRQVDLSGQHIFLPQGDLANPALAIQLGAVGARVTTITAYRNIRPNPGSDALAQPFDAITFTSASTIQNFVALFDNPLAVIGAARVVCIGPISAQAAQDAGMPVHAIAKPHTIEGLIQALVELF